MDGVAFNRTPSNLSMPDGMSSGGGASSALSLLAGAVSDSSSCPDTRSYADHTTYNSERYGSSAEQQMRFGTMASLSGLGGGTYGGTRSQRMPMQGMTSSSGLPTSMSMSAQPRVMASAAEEARIFGMMGSAQQQQQQQQQTHYQPRVAGNGMNYS